MVSEKRFVTEVLGSELVLGPCTVAHIHVRALQPRVGHACIRAQAIRFHFVNAVMPRGMASDALRVVDRRVLESRTRSPYRTVSSEFGHVLASRRLIPWREQVTIEPRKVI